MEAVKYFSNNAHMVPVDFAGVWGISHLAKWTISSNISPLRMGGYSVINNCIKIALTWLSPKTFVKHTYHKLIISSTNLKEEDKFIMEMRIPDPMICTKKPGDCDISTHSIIPNQKSDYVARIITWGIITCITFSPLTALVYSIGLFVFETLTYYFMQFVIGVMCNGKSSN